MLLLASPWLLTPMILWITALFLAYKYFTRNFDYWKKRGVHYPKPLPFIGNFYEMITFKLSMSHLIQKFYHQTEEPYFGIFAFDKPIWVVKSPELIKDILIKDFNVFCNRTVADSTHSKYVSNFIFLQKHEKWKYTRAKLTSLFTSSMVKIFFTEIQLINKRFVEYLTNIPDPVDAKYIGSHFSNEMIARCFFATDPRCFDQTTSTFRQYITTVFDFSIRNGLVQTCYFLRQNVVKFLKLDFLKHSFAEYFENLFLNAMECRKEYTGKPANMVDVVNCLQRTHNGKYPDLDLLVCNAIFLLIAGQEATSSTIGYILYELAIHPDIQEKLRKSIKENWEMHGGITYEGIQKNKYLDMVINETLRKYGALPFIDREATSDYRLAGTDLVIEKGMSVFIPLFATMRDAKYFPNPDQFDPERFADNMINSDELTFFPFGEGPRACIGRRLAVLAVGSCLSHILQKFKIEKTPYTADPLEFEPKSFVLQSKGGLPVKFTLLS